MDSKHVIKGRFQQLGSQRGVSTIGLHEKKADPAFTSNHIRRDKYVHTAMGIKHAQIKGTRLVQKHIH